MNGQDLDAAFRGLMDDSLERIAERAQAQTVEPKVLDQAKALLENANEQNA